MKIIFVSQRVDIVDSYNERRDAIDQRWIDLLGEGGNAVFPIPNNIENLKRILTLLKPDLFILTGGNSHMSYGGQAEERDRLDEYLIEYSLSNRVSLLGVCRGMQSIVIHFDGTLKQVVNHVAIEHDIFNKNGKLLGRVNSYHNYSVNDIPECLDAIAYSTDGEVEAIKYKYGNIYGIMWHPERTERLYAHEQDILEKLFDLEL